MFLKFLCYLACAERRMIINIRDVYTVFFFILSVVLTDKNLKNGFDTCFVKAYMLVFTS